VSMPGKRDLGGTGATPCINTTERRSNGYLHIGTLHDAAPFGVVRDRQR
jgi:hypothetical protein